jgi:hypothetical protein
VQPGRKLRGRLQLPDVPGPRGKAGRARGPGRAPLVRREHRIQGNSASTEGSLVSGSYFPVLGLHPAAGRLLTPEDDRTIGANFVAVLAYSYWETQHGLNPAIIGDVIVVNGQSMTVVGVAPKGFEGTTLGDRPRVYVPISMRGLMSPNFTGFENRRSYWAMSSGGSSPV